MRSTWTTSELQEDYEVLGFAYGMCVVKRKADGVKGSLYFHRVVEDDKQWREYYGFQEA
jgi:hypothetical protein